MPLPARAQLGATPGEMVKRYGPVFRHNARIWHGQFYNGTALDGDVYKLDNLYIRAVFRQGRVILLELSRLDDALKQPDVDAFLKINAENSRWEEGKDSTLESKFYHRQDGTAVAQWSIGYNGSLLVSAEEPGRMENKMLQ